jgi:hypothetical protein
MFRLLRLPLRERPHTLGDENARERELQLFRHDYVSLARRLANMMVRGVGAILFAIGGIVVLSVLLDMLAKMWTRW